MHSSVVSKQFLVVATSREYLSDLAKHRNRLVEEIAILTCDLATVDRLARQFFFFFWKNRRTCITTLTLPQSGHMMVDEALAKTSKASLYCSIASINGSSIPEVNFRPLLDALCDFSAALAS